MRFVGFHLPLSAAVGAVAFLLAVCAGPASAQQFQNAVSYSTHAAAPLAIAVGDFNNDGRLDLAVQCGTVLDIFFALQNGAFGKRVQTLTTGSEYAMAVADFNRDGNADVVLAERSQSGMISVLLGKGDGTFQPQVEYPTGARYTAGAAVADLNGDGVIDIVAINNNKQGSASVFLGNGDGTFRSAMNYPVGPQARSVVIADFNRDGVADLAVTAGTSVRVLIGVGDGTFLPHVDYPARFGASGIAAADLNSDGKIDLAVAGANSQVVSVLLGNGDGTFAAKKDSPTGAAASSIAVADFNHDGILDVLTNQCDATCQVGAAGNVLLLLGNGDGTFQPPTLYPVGKVPDAVVAADFNRDGFPDVAVADYFSGTADVLLNTGQ